MEVDDVEIVVDLVVGGNWNEPGVVSFMLTSRRAEKPLVWEPRPSALLLERFRVIVGFVVGGRGDEISGVDIDRAVGGDGSAGDALAPLNAASLDG